MFLLLLLHEIRGAISFIDIRTVDGYVCASNGEAAFRLGLLQDDRHWMAVMSEASVSCTGGNLRTLFAILLKYCDLGDSGSTWLR
ncbi:Hypothetical predicted protein [Octopus vulgaris]|uniref:Uncharacterized protein n=1 Tax=Octopus vulgaris TaxID=6645 RepID=A0AA36AVG0_OCTVU|nr:Hypothetical predicted protein [Octopus vulgaris]